MTKADLVEKIVKQTGLTRKEVSKVVEGFMEAIKDSLSKDKNVYLRGFGSFVVKHKAEKIGRNISQNTAVTIPAHDVPGFRPAKEFKDTLKNDTSF